MKNQHYHNHMFRAKHNWHLFTCHCHFLHAKHF
jgi:hypothetical protein